MFKIPHILPKRFSAKRISSYGKTALLGNIALGLIVLPTGNITTINQTSSESLIIPQEKLDIAFKVSSNEDAEKTQIPVDFFYISQGFGKFHPAIDFAAKYGQQIKPIKTGKVLETGFSFFGYGNEVVIDHGNGLESLYAHLSKIFIKKGDEVNLNSVIGLVGTTGHATGPHLHLEIRVEGKLVNPFSILPPLTSQTRNLLTLNQQ